MYELYHELSLKGFKIEDSELRELHSIAANHIEEAILYDNDDQYTSYQRDYELERAKDALETFEMVRDLSKKTNKLEP